MQGSVKQEAPPSSRWGSSHNIRMFAAIAMLMTVVALIIISGVDLGYFNWIFAIGFIILIIVGLLTR